MRPDRTTPFCQVPPGLPATRRAPHPTGSPNSRRSHSPSPHERRHPMSYWDIADMAGNLDLQARIYACVAQETGTTGGTVEFLVICGAPGWADAWASALASD